MLSQRLAPFLKPLLLLDAASCTLVAAACLGAGPALSQALAIPEVWLFEAGIICAASALLGLWLATRAVVPPKGVLLIVGANLLWGIASVASVMLGLITPTPFGAALTIGQGIAVMALAQLEYTALRGQSATPRTM